MELIIKPTEACNFKCSFCSSTRIAESKSSRLDQDRIFRFLERFPATRHIIVNGGDPLMVPPEYYWKIIRHLEERGLGAKLCLTTNLWGFYRNPDRWTELFRHPRVSVGTSFNYGGTRRVSESQEFTEDLFWKVSDLFLERVGYRPEFIAVVTEENVHDAIRTVELARRMGVVCKLNPAMASGEQGRPFVLSRMYEIYLEVHARGLSEWEFNTRQMLDRVKHRHTLCPQNRDCDSGIRCLQPEGDYYSCGSFADDRDYSIDFDAEMESSVPLPPLRNEFELQFLKSECLGCPMFEICNGCRKTIKDMKRSALVEEHCAGMKRIAPRVLALGASGGGRS